MKRTDGEDRTFAIDTYGKQIPSEAGTLFLDVGGMEIVEIRCAE